MRRITGLPLRLMAVLAVVITALVATAGPASAGALDTEHRTFTNYTDGYCLYEDKYSPTVVAASSNTNCNPDTYYTWKGNSDYTIRNTATGFCLTTTAATIGDTSEPVTAALCNGSGYQKWSWANAGRGTAVLQFHNLGNNWYLDHSKFDSPVFTSPGTGTDTQAWFQCISLCAPLPH
jgi:hypothetical protein